MGHRWLTTVFRVTVLRVTVLRVTVLRVTVFRVTVALVSIGLVAACTGAARQGNTARDAAVYHSVIVDLADRSTVDLDESEALPVLYVEGLASGVPLEVQVEVVAEFAEQYEIRFIDELEEAIDVDEAGRPARSNSLLIGLGPIVGDGTASLRGELYVRDGEAQAYGYELRPSGGGRWAIVGEPEPIVPEGFDADQ